MTTWREHVASYRKKHGGSLKEALIASAPSWKAQNAKDKKDESAGMKGKRKGTKSKTHKNDKDFTTKKGDKDFHREGKDVKEKRRPYTRRKKESVGCSCGH